MNLIIIFVKITNVNHREGIHMDTKTILSIVVWGLLGLIVLLTLLGLLAGLAKGLVKTTVKTLIKAGFVVGFVFLAPALAKVLGNTDFSGLGIYLPCATGTDANGTIQFADTLFTTPVEYFANFITGTGLISPMNGISVYQLSLSIAYSLLSYVVFLLLMILCQIFISLITAIIYNVFLRWFLPMPDATAKKKHLEECHNNKRLASVTEDLIDEDGNAPAKKGFKLHRGWGALLGAAQEFVFACTLLAPITSLARTAIDNKKDINTLLSKMGQETYIDTVNTCSEGVENAWVYKLLGAFNYDTLLMNKISSQNDLNTPFSVMVKDIFTISEPVLNSDAITGSYENGTTKITINYSILLSESMISNVLDSIVSNAAVMGLIPPLVDVALNYAANGSSIPLDQIDLTDVDWSSDLTALKDIYNTIYSMGIKSLITADGTGFDVKNFKMETSTYTDENINAIATAIKNFANLSSVKKNLSSVMAGLGGYLASLGFDVLPSEENAYEDVNWGDDLSTLIKNVLLGLRTAEIDLSFQNFQLIKQDMLDDNTNEMTVKIKDCLKNEDKRHAIRDILIDDDGILSITLIKDKVKLAPIVDTVIQTVPSLQQFADTTSYQEALELLNDSGEVKSEVRVAFALLDILLDEDNPVTITNIRQILNGTDSNSLLSYVNEDVCDELIRILDVAEESSLFNSLYGPLMKTYLYSYYNNNKDKDNLTNYFFGLTPYSFDYEAGTFTSDIKDLLRLAPQLKDFYNKYSELAKKSYHDLLKGVTNEDIDLIGDFLKVIANSEFLNAAHLDGASDQVVKNANITTVLTNMLSVDALESFKISLPSASEMGNIQWTSTDSQVGEIDNICAVLKSVVTNRDLIIYVYDHRSELLDISSYKDLKKDVYKNLLKLVRTEEQQYAVADFVINAYNSDVLRETALNTITDRLQAYLNKLGIPFSLDELRNYAYNPNNKQSINEDLQSFRNLIPLLQKINYHEVYSYLKNREFGNLLRAIPTDTLNICLTSFTTSNIYTHTGSTAKDLVPIGFYVVLKKFGFFDEDSFNLTDYGWQVFDPTTYGTDWTTATDTITDTDTGLTYKVTTSGEIDVVIRLIEAVQQTDLHSLKNKKMPTYYPKNWLENNKDIFSDAYFRNLFSLYEPSVLEYAIDTYGDKLPKNYKDLILDVIDYIDFGAVNKKDSSGNYVVDLYQDAVIMKNLAKKLISKYNGGERFFRYLMNHITTLDDGALQRISDIIDDVKQIDILYMVKDGKEMNVVTAGVYYFTQLADGEYLPYLTLSKAKDNLQILKSIVMDIQDEGWNLEFDRLYEVIVAAQGLGDINDLSLYGDGRNAASLSKLFTALNNSRLLHRAPIYVIQEASDEANFESLLGSTSYSLEFKVHLDYTPEDLAYWQNDYDLFLEMIYDEDLKSLFDSGSGFSTLDFSDIKTKILYYFGSLNLFKDVRSELIYNILEKYVDTEMGQPFIKDIFLDSVNTPYGEDDTAWRIEDLYFSNPKLTNADGTLNKEKAFYDNAMLDDVLDFLLSKSDVFKNAKDFTSVYNSLKNDDGSFTFFEDMTKKTLAVLEDGTLYRSDFTSEIVAGAMKMIVENEDLQDYLGALSSLDFYGSYIDSATGKRKETYELVNPVEGHALDQVIICGYKMSNGETGDVTESVQIPVTIHITVGELDLGIPYNVTYTGYYSKAYLKTIFTSFEADKESTDVIIKLISKSTYSTNVNSKIATLAIQDRTGVKVGSYTITHDYLYAYIAYTYGAETALEMDAAGLLNDQTVDVILKHSSLGLMPVKLSDGTYQFLDDALDFTKLDTTSFVDLLEVSDLL